MQEVNIAGVFLDSQLSFPISYDVEYKTLIGTKEEEEDKNEEIEIFEDDLENMQPYKMDFETFKFYKDHYIILTFENGTTWRKLAEDNKSFFGIPKEANLLKVELKSNVQKNAVLNPNNKIYPNEKMEPYLYFTTK